MSRPRSSRSPSSGSTATISTAVMPEAEAAVHVREAIDLLDSGQARVAEVVDGESSCTSG